MAVKVESLSPTKMTFTIDVEAGQVKQEREKVFQEMAKALQLKGFRKGKAPRKMIEKFIDQERLRKELLSRLTRKAFESSLKAEKIRPLTPPEVEVVHFKEEEPFTFKATFERWPEVPLPNYKGVEVKVEKREMKEEEVENVIETLRKQRGTGEDPELNDAFAQSLGDEFKSVDELKKAVRKQLQSMHEHEEKSQGLKKLLEQWSETVEFPVPNVLIEEKLKQFERETLQMLQQQGKTFTQFLKEKHPEVFSIAGTKEEEQVGRALTKFREDLKPQAVKQAKVDLILDEVARRESLRATQEEVSSEIGRLARSFQMSPEAVGKALRDKNVFYDFIGGMLRAKAALVVRENLKISH